MELKATILEESGIYRYFDKNGTELFAGDTIRYDDGTTEKLFLSKEGQLGIELAQKRWRSILGIRPLSIGQKRVV